MIKLQACKFIEKRLLHWCFPLQVRKFLRTLILKNISERLPVIILQFLCFRMSIYNNYKEKLIFWEKKCSLKLDYDVFFKDHVKIGHL